MPPPLRITLYDLTLSERPLTLTGPGQRFVYVERGRLTTGGAAYEADSGFFAPERLTCTGEGRAWLYEVAPAESPLAAESSLSLVISRRAAPPTDAPRLMRADRIESPPGAATPRHGHRGPGLRRLIKGRLMAEIGVDGNHLAFAETPQPFADPFKGVRRNDPCPCGSGKKFKKCCLH